MTTPAAERLYEAQHLHQMEGKKTVVYNPGDKKLQELPIIYGFNNGGNSGWLSAQLIAEDGTALGGHCCSSEGYMPHDLGILEGTRSDRHDDFKKHYPNGYRMEFIPKSKVEGHAGLDEACKKNQAKAKEKANAV